MPSLSHLIYASTASSDFADKDLQGILEGARIANEALGVTGMLLYTERSFFQVLEGDDTVITELFVKIAMDGRHERIVRIIKEPIPRRSFGDWTMGFSTMTRQEITATVGLNDFFGQGSCFDHLDGGRAKKILAAFGEGRWRARLGGQMERAPVATT